MSIQIRLVLSTLCVFNAFVLTIIGAGSIAFVDGSFRFFLAAGLWVAAVVLLRLARRLRRDVEWK